MSDSGFSDSQFDSGLGSNTPGGGGITCSWCRQNLDAWRRGDMTEKQASSITEHLRACPTCLAHLNEAEAIGDLLKDNSDLNTPELVGPEAAGLMRSAWDYRPTSAQINPISSPEAYMGSVISRVRTRIAREQIGESQGKRESAAAAAVAAPVAVAPHSVAADSRVAPIATATQKKTAAAATTSESAAAPPSRQDTAASERELDPLFAKQRSAKVIDFDSESRWDIATRRAPAWAVAAAIIATVGLTSWIVRHMALDRVATEQRELAIANKQAQQNPDTVARSVRLEDENKGSFSFSGGGEQRQGAPGRLDGAAMASADRKPASAPSETLLKSADAAKKSAQRQIAAAEAAPPVPAAAPMGGATNRTAGAKVASAPPAGLGVNGNARGTASSPTANKAAGELLDSAISKGDIARFNKQQAVAQNSTRDALSSGSSSGTNGKVLALNDQQTKRTPASSVREVSPAAPQKTEQAEKSARAKLAKDAPELQKNLPSAAAPPTGALSASAARKPASDSSAMTSFFSDVGATDKEAKAKSPISGQEETPREGERAVAASGHSASGGAIGGGAAPAAGTSRNEVPPPALAISSPVPEQSSSVSSAEFAPRMQPATASPQTQNFSSSRSAAKPGPASSVAFGATNSDADTAAEPQVDVTAVPARRSRELASASGAGATSHASSPTGSKEQQIGHAGIAVRRTGFGDTTDLTPAPSASPAGQATAGRSPSTRTAAGAASAAEPVDNLGRVDNPTQSQVAPGSAAEVYYQAESARLAGRHQEAVDAYERVARAQPNSELAAFAYRRIGDIALDNLNDPARAKRAYRSCLAPPLSNFLDANTRAGIQARLDSIK